MSRLGMLFLVVTVAALTTVNILVDRTQYRKIAELDKKNTELTTALAAVKKTADNAVTTEKYTSLLTATRDLATLSKEWHDELAARSTALEVGVRGVMEELAGHLLNHEDLARSVAALTEVGTKVEAVRAEAKQLVLAIEASRQAVAGVETGSVTVFTSEDQVISAIEVANLADRLSREIEALKTQLAEAKATQEKLEQTTTQPVEEDGK